MLALFRRVVIVRVVVLVAALNLFVVVGMSIIILNGRDAVTTTRCTIWVKVVVHGTFSKRFYW